MTDKLGSGRRRSNDNGLHLVPFKQASTSGQHKVRNSKDKMGGPQSEECQRKQRRENMWNINKWQTELIFNLS